MTVLAVVPVVEGIVRGVGTFLTEESAQAWEQKWLAEQELSDEDD